MHGNLDDHEFIATKSDAPFCSDTTGAEINCTDLQGPLFFALLCGHMGRPKPWAWLLERDSLLKERSAHNYAGGYSVPDSRLLAKIIQADDGLRAVAYLAQFSTWWPRVERALKLQEAIDGVK